MSIVFHGSPNHRIKKVLPGRHHRAEKVSGEHITIFDQPSFHASPHRWIALAYLYHEVRGYSMGVDLYGSEIQVTVIGPTDPEDSLQRLYGKGGYLHSFSDSDFWWCEGLGNREVITDKEICPLVVMFIKDPVAEMRAEGVEFIFYKDG